jgi:signal transduction histidine kinase
MQEPLRKIKSFSQKLEKKNISLDDDSKTYLRKIKSGVDRMAELISDVLTYSRLTHVNRQFIPTDLNEVLNYVIDDFEIYIEEKKATIRSDALPSIMAIPLQMSQLFHNLIGNSLKFSKKDIPCMIDIRSRMLCDQERDDHGLDNSYSYCEITIADNGIGFRQEYAENIFKIFHRLNHRGSYEGSGIGLALCRKIIGNHSGKLFATSEEHVGTCFTVILPVSR